MTREPSLFDLPVATGNEGAGVPHVAPAPELAGLVRRTDPTPSHAAARIARVGSQRWRILRYLGDIGVCTADELHARWPSVERSVWSTRLSAMASTRDGRTPLIEAAGTEPKVYADGTSHPVTRFRLSEAGRQAARQAS